MATTMTKTLSTLHIKGWIEWASFFLMTLRHRHQNDIPIKCYLFVTIVLSVISIFALAAYWFCCCCCCCLDRTFDFVKFVFFAFWFDKSSASSNSWIYQCTNICIFVRALQRQQMALFSLSLSGFNEFTTNQLSQQMNKWKCFLCEVVVFGDHCNLHTRALFDKWYSVYCLAYIWTQMRPWSRMKWVEAGKKPHHNTQRCNKSNDIFNAFPLIIRDEASNRPDFTS